MTNIYRKFSYAALGIASLLPLIGCKGLEVRIAPFTPNSWTPINYNSEPPVDHVLSYDQKQIKAAMQRVDDQIIEESKTQEKKENKDND